MVLGHAFPTPCRAHVRLTDALLSLCPSLPSLRGKLPFVVRLVPWYYGTVRLLLNVRVRLSVYGLRGPVLIARPRRAGDLPVLVHVVSQRARVLRLRRTDHPLAICVRVVLPSSTSERSQHPDPNGLFEAQSPRLPIPLSTLQAAPRGVACKTRGQDGFAVILSCRALSFPTTCRGGSAPVARPAKNARVSPGGRKRMERRQ
jgi:hypothetical protein